MTELPPGLAVIPDQVSDYIADHYIELMASGLRNDPMPGVNGIDHVQRIWQLDGVNGQAVGGMAEALWLCDSAEPHMGFPDSIIATSYTTGATLDAHPDPFMWSDEICVFNIGANVTIRFQRLNPDEVIDVEFPDRALMVMGGESRRDWLHGIERVEHPRIAIVCRKRR